MNSPRESRSMSMDIDDNTIPCCHPDSCGHIGTELRPKNHQVAEASQMSLHSLSGHLPLGRERLPVSDDSPQFMVLAPSSSPSTELGVASRKRKHSLEDLTHTVDQDRVPRDAAFVDGAHSQSSRRVRPRRRTQQDREFTPLLIMPPDSARESLAEETISAFHYPPVADLPGPSYSIRRHFSGDPSEGGPRIPQSSDDLGNQEHGRSDSAGSFAELALASTTTSKRGRLSTLDLWVPRPFEDTGPSVGSIKVHERGLEALPSFLLPIGHGRMDGQRASCELVGSPTDTLGHSIHPFIRGHSISATSPQPALYPLDLSTGSLKYFDGPMCDSPESISPDENYLAHIERAKAAREAHRGSA